MSSAGENTVNSAEMATSGSAGLQNRQPQLRFASRDDLIDRKPTKPRQRCSVSTTVLGALISMIWALWIFLIVLYYTDLVVHSDNVLVSESSANTTSTADQVLINETSANTTTTNELCQSQNVYTGDVCKTVLRAYQTCLTDRIAGADTDISIGMSTGVSQEEIEAQVVELLGGLQLLNPSPDCQMAALPFFCRYAFPLCDSSGELYLPSFGECETLTTETCSREWRIAVNIIGSEDLPQCALLSSNSEQFECAQGNEIIFETADNSTPTCSEGFYSEDNSNCLPECGVWQLYSSQLETAIMVLVILVTSVGIVAGTIVVVVSCSQYKRMFRFPNSLIVYQTVTVLVNSVTVLISYTNNTALFCTSKNLVESLPNSSPYCTFTGVVFQYMYWQLAVFWIIHILTLFWGIRFPFHARSFGAAGRNRYLHIATILLGLIIPCVPIGIIFGTGGFEISRFPPIICGVTSRDVIFYSTILPISTLDAIGFCLLLVIFWTIRKMQHQHRARTSTHQIGTPEFKALIIVSYFLGVGLYAVILFGITYQVWPKGRFSKVLLSYLQCESITPGTCDRSMVEEAILTVLLLDVALILVGFLPVVNIIYIVNAGELKKRIQGSTRRLRTLSKSVTGISKASIQTSLA